MTGVIGYKRNNNDNKNRDDRLIVVVLRKRFKDRPCFLRERGGTDHFSLCLGYRVAEPSCLLRLACSALSVLKLCGTGSVGHYCTVPGTVLRVRR
jgi:hypothetical protein